MVYLQFSLQKSNTEVRRQITELGSRNAEVGNIQTAIHQIASTSS
jgi:hypothetical protein